VVDWGGVDVVFGGVLRLFQRLLASSRV